MTLHLVDSPAAVEARLAARVASTVAGGIASGMDSRFVMVERKLDALAEGVAMTQQTANAILSSQEIARRFETTRDEMLKRVEEHEAFVAAGNEQLLVMIAERIAEHEAVVEVRVATLEALSFGTLLRLAARRLIGR